MIVCGIVVEYNPFHNGHLYHIKEARKLTNCDVLIAIMSPTFMQRGEPAIINKFDRTKFALDHDIDLVIEMPSIFAIQSANYFAKGALKILNELKIDYLVFGSESNDLLTLKQAAKISLDSKYQSLVKKHLQNGQRYAIACNNAFEDYNINPIKLSNDILGLAYLQEIYQNNYEIEPISIKRNNEYLSTKINSDIASATAIRNSLLNKDDISTLTPMATMLEKKYDELVFLNDFFYILKYQLLTNSIEQLKTIKGFDEGLEYLFKNTINKVSNIDDFINLVSSKRYPKTRIQRTIIYLICNIKKDELNVEIDYIRVLGMNSIGQKYLKKQKDKTSYKILTTLSKHNSLALDLEQRITNVYSLAKPSVNYLSKKEYQQSVIIKKEHLND
ncbi:putative nucleotidyltransferase [Bacilli bacterium PM5-3]|nr:putative nucleotidyltransferase [Bacilli bacterium PM5-3]MDH6603199.1 putative nucleotidyltransferase [Bacilli bacterium PM5-9]